MSESIDSPRLTHRVFVSESATSCNKASCAALKQCSHMQATTIQNKPPPHCHLPLPRRVFWGFSVGHTLNDMFAACWFSYLLLFLQKVAGLHAEEAGLVMLSGQLADAIATPAVGIFSDKSKGFPSLGLGRRKTYYFFGTLLCAGSFYLVFGDCLLCLFSQPSRGLLIFYYCLTASLFNVGWASVQVSHMSFLPELSRDETERVMLNSARFGFTVFANVIIFVFFYLLINLFDLSQHEQYRYLTIATLLFGGALSIFFMLGTREKVAQPKKSKSAASSSSSSSSSESSEKSSAVPCTRITNVPCTRLNSNKSINQTPEASSIADVPYLPLAADEKDENSNSSVVTISSDVTPSIPPPVDVSFTGPKDSLSSLKAKLLSKSTSSPAYASVNSSEGPMTPGSGEIIPPAGTIPSSLLEPAQWKKWLGNRFFYQVGLIYMCTRLVMNVSQTLLSFYLLDALLLPQSSITIVPLVLYVAQLAATVCMKRINNYFGRKLAYTVGAAFIAVASVAMLFLKSSFPYLIFPAIVSLGIGCAITTVISVQMQADMLGVNTASAAFVYGCHSFTDKLSNGVAIYVVQQINGDSMIHVRASIVWVPLVAVMASVVLTYMLDFETMRAANAVDQEGRHESVDESQLSSHA